MSMESRAFSCASVLRAGLSVPSHREAAGWVGVVLAGWAPGVPAPGIWRTCPGSVGACEAARVAVHCLLWLVGLHDCTQVGQGSVQDLRVVLGLGRARSRVVPWAGRSASLLL